MKGFCFKPSATVRWVARFDARAKHTLRCSRTNVNRVIKAVKSVEVVTRYDDGRWAESTQQCGGVGRLEMSSARATPRAA